MMKVYLNHLENIVADKFRVSLSNPVTKLLRNKWYFDIKSETPEQKESIIKIQEDLENFFEDYFEPHLKVTRAFQYNSPTVEKCIDLIQVFRKEGIRKMLVQYCPSFLNKPYTEKKTDKRSMLWYAFDDGLNIPPNPVVPVRAGQVDAFGEAVVEAMERRRAYAIHTDIETLVGAVQFKAEHGSYMTYRGNNIWFISNQQEFELAVLNHIAIEHPLHPFDDYFNNVEAVWAAVNIADREENVL